MQNSPVCKRGFLTSPLALLRVVSLGFLIAFGAFSASSVKAQDFRFSNFRLDGGSQVELPAILGFAGLNAGQSYSAGELNQALQRLQATGLFDNVAFIPRGGTLVVQVSEFPTVNRISVEGNRNITDEVAARLIQTQERRVFRPSQVEADANTLVEAYADLGRVNATVTPRFIRRSGNRVDVVFEVSEGRVTEIERLSFVGNRAFTDRRLRRVLETKQAGALRFLIGKDTFVEDRIGLDRVLLRDFYQARGYVDFQILSVSNEFSRERNGFFLTFTVQEGQKYKFGEITTSSEVPGVDAADFARLARIRSGRTYTPELVDNTISRMEALAQKKGLNLVRVDPRVTRNDADLTLDIDFALVEGPRIFIERIDIAGNATTLDRVIRRQFRVVEGDPFNPREIREAAARIRALGLFTTAEVNAREGTASDQVMIDVEVEETTTGSLQFGAAYNLATGIGLTAEFKERNFLGRGQTLNFDFKLGLDNSQGGMTFIEPAFLSRDLQFRFDGEYRQTEYDYTDYDTQTYLVRPSFEFPLGEKARLGLRYSLTGDRIFNVAAGSSGILQAEEAAGRQVSSGLGYTLSYDTRTTGVNPNAGVLVRLGQDFAGLGGNARSIKTTALMSAETRVWNDDVTLRATLEGGALTTFGADSRLNDRFFLTAAKMRGFAPAGVGPRDLTVANRDALGGNYFAVARFESEFPLGLPEEFGFSGGAFFDVGSVWGLDNTGGGAVDDDLYWRATAGVSLFWQTPIGPLRFNFSRPLQKENYDKGQVFDLTIATQF